MDVSQFQALKLTFVETILLKWTFQIWCQNVFKILVVISMLLLWNAKVRKRRERVQRIVRL